MRRLQMKIKIKTYPSDEDNKKITKEIEVLQKKIDKSGFNSPIRGILVETENEKGDCKC